MRNIAVPVTAVVLVVVGLAGIVATTMFTRSVGTSRVAGGRGMDAMFIEQMIPHHDDAIAMAELASDKAEHPEIRQLAEDIRRTQTAENAQMRAWYRQWFGIEVPDARGSSGMMGGMMGSGTTDMADLEVAEPFDKAFIEAMIPHHQMAIMMSQMAGSASGRSELRGLTSSIIEAQSAEITKMQTWYEEWYGR